LEGFLDLTSNRIDWNISFMALELKIKMTYYLKLVLNTSSDSDMETGSFSIWYLYKIV